jgi:hypothetical protein
MGSNKDNPFAKDPEPKSLKDKMLDWLAVVLVIVLFIDIAAIFVVSSAESKKEEALKKSFQDGDNIWCKAGDKVNMEIRINQKDGWAYDESKELLINNAKGITMQMSHRMCRQ